MTLEEIKAYFNVEVCPYCKSSLKVHFNTKGEAMRFYCPSSSCEAFLIEKAKAYLEEFGHGTDNLTLIKKTIASSKADNIVDLMFSLLNTLPLEGFLRLSFIPTMTRSKILTIIKGSVTNNETLDDIIQSIRENHIQFESVLAYYEKYKDKITIPEYQEYKRIINIMITGSITTVPGLTRETFDVGLSALTEGRITVKTVGKRKTNVYALVVEDKNSASGKAEVARQSNGMIKIMTPTEFIADFYENFLKGEISV